MSDVVDSVRVVDERTSAPAGWDARAVAPPGGHVLQSSTWADYRIAKAEDVRFLTFDDDAVALAMVRRSPGLPGVEISVRRGPAHRDDPASLLAARAQALADWARAQGGRELYLDPEHDADPTYATAMQAAGFTITAEREPSIHVMRLTFGAELDEEALFKGLSKSTRQRIRAAQGADISVREATDTDRMEAFAELLRERADVVGMQLQQGTGYLEGWRRLIEAGLGRLLVAEHDGGLVGGLFLFRQGGIYATAYSADKASLRRELPGTMHLVRWNAVRDAQAEGCPAIELGGVDLPGHREPPQQGDPNRGLYEHKRGFGAEWVQREPARRVVLRAGAERMARLRRRAIDGLRGMRR
jgi:lipid II:glycine glycyltransferase (peptidoglycan interpeptide bridge formation enzyme)